MIRGVIHHRNRTNSTDEVYIGREHSGRGRGPSYPRSPWANPWNWRIVGRDQAVDLYARWIAGDAAATALLPGGRWQRPTVEAIRQELAGKVLVCWCEPGTPCHGHVLQRLADHEHTSHTAGTSPADSRREP